MKKYRTIHQKIEQYKKLTIKYRNRSSYIANIATDVSPIDNQNKR